MKRIVKSDLIREWIRGHSPDGMFKLAQKSGVSAWTIAKVKSGYVPKKQVTRRLLAAAMGEPEDALFPFVGAKGRAS